VDEQNAALETSDSYQDSGFSPIASANKTGWALQFAEKLGKSE
jgi:hypothetical protein